MPTPPYNSGVTAIDPFLETTVAQRYEVRAFAHEEAMGRVYTARDTEAQRLVHLKVLGPQVASDARAFRRFGREITASFMVSHPNTVEVLDFGDDAGQLYLVMEYLKAHPLSDELVRGPLEPLRVAALAAQVAAAIGAAHQEAILHRNLCADNVLFLDNAVDGVAIKVRDFGMAKLEGADATEGGLTTANTRLGVAAYTAPEYISTGEFHVKGDLYALGAILWHALVGRPPYEGNIEQVLQAAMAGPPPAPSTLRDGIPDWLDALVVDLLATSPQDRPGAYKVVQRLEAGAGGALPTARCLPLDADGEPIADPAPPAPARGGMALVAVAAVAVAGVVLVGLVVIGLALCLVMLQVLL